MESLNATNLILLNADASHQALVEGICQLFNMTKIQPSPDQNEQYYRVLIINIIGYIAGVLTTFASSPQIYKTIKTRNTMALSMPALLVLWAGLVGWTMYGILLLNWVIIICNVIALSLYTLLITLKCVFDAQQKAKLRAESLEVEMDPIYKPVVTNKA